MSRTPPNTKQVLAEQAREAKRTRQAPALAPKTAPAPVPAVAKGNGNAVAVAASDTRTPQERYLDEIAPVTFVGQLIKFSKDGKFLVSASGDGISPEQDFVALADETLVGWIKYNGQGEQPTRAQGILYDGFVMPERESLGDTDEATWPMGLDGHPADPWQHQICLVLQNRETQEFFTFATSSTSGRRAVGNLLRHYERLRRSHPDTYPIVRLKPGGYNHKDTRVGWVATPTFAVVGRAPKDSAAKPDSSPAADLNDGIGF